MDHLFPPPRPKCGRHIYKSPNGIPVNFFYSSPSLSSLLSSSLSQSDLECRMVDKGAIWFGKATSGIGVGRETGYDDNE